MNTQQKPLFYKLRWLLWPQLGLAILITILAYLGKIPLRFLAWPYADKVMHFLLFGLVAFWLSFWVGTQNSSSPKKYFPVVILLSLIFIEEGFQSLSPNRTLEIGDMACDLAGVLTFWMLGDKINRKSNSQPLPLQEFPHAPLRPRLDENPHHRC